MCKLHLKDKIDLTPLFRKKDSEIETKPPYIDIESYP